MLAVDALCLQAQTAASTKICLVPPAVEGGSNASAATQAILTSFTTFLTGPTLSSHSLQAPLASQAREEARQAGCPFILLTTLKVVSRQSGGGLLGTIAAGVARQGAVEAGIAGGTAAARIATSAAAGVVQEATQDFAGTIRTRDEVTLGWRLESADGKVLGEKREKRSAKNDGEDLITPLVQWASEQVVEVAQRKSAPPVVPGKSGGTD